MSKRMILKRFTVRLLLGLMIVSSMPFSSLFTLPVLASGPDGTEGWTECAAEGAACTFSGTKEVRFWGIGTPAIPVNYGFTSQLLTGGALCTSAAFGYIDPTPGTIKKCYYRDVQLDSKVTSMASENDKKVTFTFHIYAIQAGTLDDLKSRITIKKTGETAYSALGTQDTVANPTSTSTSSTLEIYFKDALVGSENTIQIAPGAFKNSIGDTIEISVTSSVVGEAPDGSLGWTNCSAISGFCNFDGTKEVRLWGTGAPAIPADYDYVSKISTYSTYCSVSEFGGTDPAFGTVKRCFYRDVQLDSAVTTTMSGPNNKATLTFHTYAKQTDTLDDLKSKITVRKTGEAAYTALGAEDTVANPTSTAASSTFVIKFKDTLVGPGNSIQIAPGAFKDNNGQPINLPVTVSITSLPTGPDGSPGWTDCGDEGGNCSFRGTKEVRLWGIGPNFGFVTHIFRDVTDSPRCQTYFIGNYDPAPGSPKRCYFRDVQLDSEMKTVVSGLNNKVTFTFNMYAVQAGTIEDLKRKIMVKRTGDSAYTALSSEDTVANLTSTTTSSTLEINFKNPLVGSGNAIQIASEAFKDTNGELIDLLVSTALKEPLAIDDAPDGSQGWTFCAVENGDCSFTGRKEVRFWATDQPDKFQSIVSINDTACTLASFGNRDPASDSSKRCYYRDVQLDNNVTTAVSGSNTKVKVAFNTYAIQAGTLEDLKSKITIKKTGDSAYTALDTEDTLANVTSTATLSTFEINMKNPLVGSENAIRIASNAFKDSIGDLIDKAVNSVVIGVIPDGSSGWSYCAVDGENCSFAGLKEVRYWGIGTPAPNYGFRSKVTSGGTACTMAAFGNSDPAYGTVKACYYRDVQLDYNVSTVVGGHNNKVTFTFNTYAIQAGTLENLKNHITVKKTGDAVFTALSPEDVVAIRTSTPTLSTLEITLKDTLVGSDNAIRIIPGAFKDLNGQPIDIAITSSLTLLGLGPDGSPGWTNCAADGGNCSFVGTKEVRYWGTGTPAVPANYGFNSQIVTSYTTCSMAAFGGTDPAPGTTKKCYFRDVQLDSAVKTAVSGPNNKVKMTFNTYAIQSGTLEELKSKITVKRTGETAYRALGAEDTVVNPTSTAMLSTLEFYFKEPLMGSDNAIQIASGTFMDSNGKIIDQMVTSPLTLLPAAPDGDLGWTYCAEENKFCGFSGKKEVRYWGIGTPAVPANYGFRSLFATDITVCSKAAFGNVDPAFGTTKRCYYRDIQLDNNVKTVVSGLNTKVTFTFNTYAIQAGSLADLKSKIKVKKAGSSSYTALDAEDTVANPTSTADSSSLEINFKDNLVGLGNTIQIAPGAFEDSNGLTINITITSSLTLLPTAPDGTLDWTDCAADNGNCSFSGTKEVRYWGIGAPAVPANYSYLSKVVTNGIGCNRDAFGGMDPAPDTYKKCYYRAVQLDSSVHSIISERPDKVTVTFHMYAIQAGTLDALKSKITIKRAGQAAYTALGPEDTVEIQSSTAVASILEINFKDALIGSGNTLQIAAGAFKDSNGQPINLSVSSPLTMPLVVNVVAANDTVITGTAEAGSIVTVSVDAHTLGTAVVTDGTFAIPIAAQTVGKTLAIFAKHAANNVSLTSTVTVTADATAPTAPLVNAVNIYDVFVTGSAEAGSTVMVKAGGSLLGTALAAVGGGYSVPIAAQVAGTQLTITATDVGLNESLPTRVIVEQTDIQAVTAAIQALSITYGGSDGAESVTQAVGLPATGINETTVIWSSNHTAINTTGMVTRPSHTVGNTTVILTATISKGVASETKVFTLFVAAEAASNNAELSSLRVSSGAWNEILDAAVTSNTLSVPNSIASLTVAPTAADGTAIVKVNGTLVARGEQSAEIPLAVGTKTIIVDVTAQDGTTTKTYMIQVRRVSNEALLYDLVVDQGTLTFDPSELVYRVDVASSVTSHLWTVTKTNSNQTLTVTGVNFHSTSVTGNVYAYTVPSLNVGANLINIQVTAEDGLATNTYQLIVNRAPVVPVISSNADLSAVLLSSGVLSPIFASGTTSYTSNVGNDISSLTVTGSVYDSKATMTVNGISTVSGQASGAINLRVGPNPITLVVTAQDGSIKTYIVIVTRGDSIPVVVPDDSNTTPPIRTTVTSTDGNLTLGIGQMGEVSLNKEVMISIPAGASAKELKITIDKVLNTKQLVTDKEVLASPIFEILKNFTENFSKPITMTFTFDKASLQSGQTAAVFYYDEVHKVWVEVPGGTINGNQITVGVNHFTKYAVFAVGQAVVVAANFSDIAGHWGEERIKQAAKNGIVSGYPDGTFKPNRTVTRAEFAVMLLNTLKLQGEGTKLNFTDGADIGAWAQIAISLAVREGWMNGYDDGSFRPNAEITRAEMAVVIAGVLGKPFGANAVTHFSDDADIPLWAKSSVAAVQQAGIMQGKDAGQFVPQDRATRAEAVTVLLKLKSQRSNGSQ
ncbi:S-layer homology domain-containing protein [Paenibacillus luteus]|uniref:S-layer homology domain-containing protein n=1 Tax=Paenibacillus luteus TaxID=2545753 RepID=UPI00137585B7|nr:S-layer homology domain-containing protein [Paenibacillus luteus]